MFIQHEKFAFIAGILFSACFLLFAGMSQVGFFYAPLLRAHSVITFVFFVLAALPVSYLWVKYAPKIPPFIVFFTLNIAWVGIVFIMGVSLNRLWIIIPYVLLITLAGIPMVQRKKYTWGVLTLFLAGVTLIYIAPSPAYIAFIVFQTVLAFLYVFQRFYLPRLMAMFSLFIPALLTLVLAFLGVSQWHLDDAKWAEVQLYGAIPNETLTVTASLESVFIETSLRVNVYQNKGLGFVKFIGQGEYLDQGMMPELNARTFDVTQLSDTLYELQLNELEPVISIEINKKTMPWHRFFWFKVMFDRLP